MRRLLFACLIAVGCGSQSAGYRVVPGPNGYPVANIWCEDSPADCYTIAGSACPWGYEIVNHSQDNYESSRAFVNQYNGFARHRSGSVHNMMVLCKAAPQQHPVQYQPTPPVTAAPAAQVTAPPDASVEAPIKYPDTD